MTFDWSQIEKFYDQGNTAGFLLAILASEKLLRSVLKEKKFPGKTFDEKLVIARAHLSAPQSFDQTRILTKQIISLNFPSTITQTTAEQVLKSYFAAITELANVSSFEIKKMRVKNTLKNWQKKIARLILYSIMAIFVILGLALFFDRTVAGQNLGAELAIFSEAIILRALPVVLGVLTVIIIAIAYTLSHKIKNYDESRTEFD